MAWKGREWSLSVSVWLCASLPAHSLQPVHLLLTPSLHRSPLSTATSSLLSTTSTDKKLLPFRHSIITHAPASSPRRIPVDRHRHPDLSTNTTTTPSPTTPHRTYDLSVPQHRHAVGASIVLISPEPPTQRTRPTDYAAHTHRVLCDDSPPPPWAHACPPKERPRRRGLSPSTSRSKRIHVGSERNARSSSSVRTPPFISTSTPTELDVFEQAPASPGRVRSSSR